MSIGYGEVERFGPDDGDTWLNYTGCFGAPHLKEIVSLDGSLCPNLVKDLTDEDWQNNLVEEGLIFYFHHLDYLLSLFDVPSNYQIVAIVKNPNGSETLDDPRFEFIGYDLIEADIEGGTSALTNCGGWDKAFADSDLAKYGLVVSFERATQIKQLLLQHYPDDPHALCDLYAVWRIIRNRSATGKASCLSQNLSERKD